jgi:hypothetical protein
MSVATATKLFSTQEAATELGVTEGRVRQICRGYKNGKKFGAKYGRDWFLTETDLEKIREEILRFLVESEN